MKKFPLKTFCKNERKRILAGMSSHGACGYVSLHLGDSLAYEGIEAFLCKGDVGEGIHCWLELADGQIIDLTADQFGNHYPTIYIGDPLPIHGLCFSRKKHDSQRQAA